MSTRIVGIGNADRGDDAVGPRTIELLREAAPPGVELCTVRGDMLAMLEAFDGASTVVLVDAMRSGAEPGTVLRLEVTAGEDLSALGHLVSTHAFGLGQAVELARSLGRLPRCLVVHGVEAETLEHGAPTSAAVERALPGLVESILEELRCTKPR